MTDDTGEKQGIAGRGGNIPPVDKRFGQPHGNRINKKGRPKHFDECRALAQSIAIGIIGEGAQRMTMIDAILRKWATSKDPRLQIAFVEYAYGKVPQRQEVTGTDGEPIKIIEIVKDNG